MLCVTTAQREVWPGKSSDRQRCPETSLVGTRLARSTWRPSWTGQGKRKGGREWNETPSLLREEAVLPEVPRPPPRVEGALGLGPSSALQQNQSGLHPPLLHPLVFSCQAAALLWDAAIKGTEA